MRTAKLFMNGKSQAVRLPKEFRFAGDEVYIKQVEGAVILIPKEDPWGSFFRGMEMFTEDFMPERGQPPIQKRKGL